MVRIGHFLAIGALLLGLRHGLEAATGEGALAPVLEIDAAQVIRLARAFELQMGSPPEPEELALLVRDAIDREILVREALRAGLHRDDPVVRSRLERNMGFVGEGGGHAFEAALALGMQHDDPVVRRRLPRPPRSSATRL